MLAINGPIVVACLAYIGWLSPLILGFGAAFAAATIAVDRLLVSAGVRHFQAARAAQESVVGHVRGLLDGFRELKQNRARREAFLRDGLGPATRRVRDHAVAGHVRFAGAEGVSQLGFFGFLGFLLLVVPQMASVERGALSGVVLVVLYIMTPLDVLLNWVPIIGRARAGLQKIEAVIGLLEASGREDGPFRPANPMRLRDVDPSGRCLLLVPPRPRRLGVCPGADRSRASHAGEIVFLAGGNGSGKTTLVKLDRRPLRSQPRRRSGSTARRFGSEDREAYRQLVSVVFADGHLFQTLHGIKHRDQRAERATARGVGSDGSGRSGQAGWLGLLDR